MSRAAITALRRVHTEGPVLHKHGHRRAHRSDGGFNHWLAVNITRVVGTMWCAYGFAFIAFIALPAAVQSAEDGNVLNVIIWLSGSFLQLVLLPVIMVGQNIAAAASDKRAIMDHRILGHEVDIAEDMHQTVTDIHFVLTKLMELQQTQMEILKELSHG